MKALRELWSDAGLGSIETREITVQRTFADFDDFWATGLLAPSTGSIVAAMPPDDVALLKLRVRAGLPADPAGRITCSARANAVKGRVSERPCDPGISQSVKELRDRTPKL
jgi:hypothetical protein